MTDRRRGLAALLGMGAGSTSASISASSAGKGVAPAAVPPTGRRLRRLVTPLLLVVAVGAAISMVAVPARSHLARTADINAAEQLLTDLVVMNEADSARLAALRTDEELEHLARRDFGLAMPGEEIYHVMSPAVDPPRVPEGWPFNHLSLRLALE